MQKFMTFGKIGASRICAWIFYFGEVGVLIAALAFLDSVSLSSLFGDERLFLVGLLCLALCFVVVSLIWRLLCEMLYTVLNFFQSNTKQTEPVAEDEQETAPQGEETT
jgi:hypothetical protein